LGQPRPAQGPRPQQLQLCTGADERHDSSSYCANNEPIHDPVLDRPNDTAGRCSSAQPYTAPDLNSGGFQDTPAGGNNGSSLPSGLSGSLGRLPGGSGNEEAITITAIAEKEGLFMFQHRNYEVGSNRRANKVVRRYSDFVWLLDCLHKRFPFRQLPLLPPKRVGSKFSP
jgi:sorting nexin-8